MITSNNPVTINPIPEQVFNTWWISEFYVNAKTPASGIGVTVTFKLCYLDGNGLPVFHPTMPPVFLDVPDFYAAAAADNSGTLANSMTAIITGCGMVGFQQGVIS